MQRLKDGATPEFLGEETYRVVEMVLGAEINYEKVDLVKLFTRCAERAIQEKVNKDTWNRSMGVGHDLETISGSDSSRNLLTSATPLYIAAHNGHEVVVSALFAAGAEKNAAIPDGRTPLYSAAWFGHEAVVSGKHSRTAPRH